MKIIYNPENLNIDLKNKTINSRTLKRTRIDESSRMLFTSTGYVLKIDSMYSDLDQCTNEYNLYIETKNERPVKLKYLAPVLAYGHYHNKRYWIIQKRITILDDDTKDFYFDEAMKIYDLLGIDDTLQFGFYLGNICFYDYGLRY